MTTLAYVLLCQGVGISSGLATARGVREWYPTLKKPSWTPPPSVFAPVWTTLYLMMGWAAGRACHDPWALRIFVIQLILNALWSPLFFSLRSPALALIDIVLLWCSIAACQAVFFAVDPLAGRLLWPYWAWVSFATLLNYELWRLNRNKI